MAQYTYIQLSAARAQLQARLQDPNAVYWATAELTAYIVESLRTWQALTGFYRDRATLSTSASTPSYDLSSSLTAGYFDYNITDVNLYTAICNHLLEPTALPYLGTDQFTQAQILAAIQNRRDQFLLDTGCVISRSVIGAGLAPVSRVNLVDSIVGVRRVAWIDINGVYTNLWRDDEYAASGFQNSWLSPVTIPNTFSVGVTQPVSLQIIPVVSQTGQLELLTVSSGPALTLVGNGVNLAIPDDFTYGVKWGALADLLGADGQNRDYERALYCEQRYQECVQAARLNPSVLQAELGTSVLWVGSLQDEDGYNTNWQNATPTTPVRAAMAGRNRIYLTPTPDATYSITLDLVRNMIVPALDTDYLQVGRENLDTILDYAQHLACFKMGGQEFSATAGLYKNLLREAMIFNNRLNASAFLRKLLEQPGQQQERLVPRFSPSPLPRNLDNTTV